jgi:hypothetical protein
MVGVDIRLVPFVLVDFAGRIAVPEAVVEDWVRCNL